MAWGQKNNAVCAPSWRTKQYIKKKYNVDTNTCVTEKQLQMMGKRSNFLYEQGRKAPKAVFGEA
jgi:hypothetical protein